VVGGPLPQNLRIGNHRTGRKPPHKKVQDAHGADSSSNPGTRWHYDRRGMGHRVIACPVPECIAVVLAAGWPPGCAPRTGDMTCGAAGATLKASRLPCMSQGPFQPAGRAAQRSWPPDLRKVLR
jgi:hypothetical protein